jgi:hypothetical protein
MGLLARLGRAEPAPPWGLSAALAYVVGAFAAVVLGTTLASALLGDRPTTFIVGWSLAMILMALAVMTTHGRRPAESAALRLSAPSRVPLPIVLLMSIGVAISIDLLSLIVAGEGWPAPALLRYYDTSVSPFRLLDVGLVAWALAALFLAIFQPLGEELIFRGMALPALRAELGPWPGYIITALIFAIFHLIAYAPSGAGGNAALTWVSIGVPFLNGLYLNGVRAYTGSTRAAVVAHAGLGLFVLLRALVIAG